MIHSRTSLLAAVVLVLPLSFLFIGCDNKKPTSGTSGLVKPAADADASILAALETKADAIECRTVLQQLDNLDTGSTRPTLSESERTDLAILFRLTEAEAKELAQASFTPSDASYLEECLLLRTAMRGLKSESRPPLERATLGFDWVCRMVYVDNNIPWTAPPWWTLQTGFGVALSRAYAILAAWQQLGLDSCLIGPPALKTTSALTADANKPTGPPGYAPVRACGVKVDKEVFLFDPASSRPFLASDGKRVLTLSQVRANPDLVKNAGVPGESATWQVFLAPPLSALSRRMEWLESRNPGSVSVKLFMESIKQRNRFVSDLAGIPCEIWNPANDSFTASRILAPYATEETKSLEEPPFRVRHTLRVIPLDRMPKTNLAGAPLGELIQLFAMPFSDLRFSPTSPRDLLLRGRFSEAINSLDQTKKLVENARQRMEQDTTLRNDFGRWVDEYQHLSAELNRAKLGDPTLVPTATRALEEFRNQSHNRDLERTFIYGSAAPTLAAEIAYLMASCVHERAEHNQVDAASQAVDGWTNARDWWGRFLEASAQAGSPSSAREAQAKLLQARCRQFIQK